MTAMDSKQRRWGAIVASAILLIVIYDLYFIWKSRPKPCNVVLQDCSADYFCSKPTPESNGRCFPRAALPPFTIDLPFVTQIPVLCTLGALDGEKHITDYNAFTLNLRTAFPEGMEKANERGLQIVAPADGRVFIKAPFVRILHRDGYYSRIGPIDQISIADRSVVSSGDILGKLNQVSDIELSVHFLNPSNAEDTLLKLSSDQNTREGLSVPFQLRSAKSLSNGQETETIDSSHLRCDLENDFRLFRAAIAH